MGIRTPNLPLTAAPVDFMTHDVLGNTSRSTLAVVAALIFGQLGSGTLQEVSVALAGTQYESEATYVADGTDDHLTIITAAEALSAAGGGILKIMPTGSSGYYDIGTGGALLSALSNVHIIGGGGKSTRFRKKTSFSGIAALVFRACSNCSVTGIFVDSNSEPGNGIAAVPTNSSFGNVSGTRSSVIGVYNCYVELEPEIHAYGIWFMDVQTGWMRGNFVDGMTTDVSVAGEQEGCECYGGSNIVVSENHCRRLNGNAYSMFTEAGHDTPATNIAFLDNTAEDIFGFLYMVPAMGRISTGTRYQNHFKNIAFERNRARRVCGRAIQFALNAGDGTDDEGLECDSISICDNRVQFEAVSGGAGSPAFGAVSFIAHLNADAGGVPADRSKFLCSNIRHERNEYIGLPENGSQLLFIGYLQGVRSRDNSYSWASAANGNTYGAYLDDEEDCALLGERIALTGVSAVQCAASEHSRLRIEDCELIDFDQGDGGIAPIVVDASSSSNGLTIRNNRARRETGTMSSAHLVVVASAASHTNWDIHGNRFVGSYAADEEINFDTTPGAGGNRGTHTMAGGATSFTITNNRIRPDSIIHVQQESGTFQAVSRIDPGSGTATVTLAAATDGSVFRWRII